MMLLNVFNSIYFLIIPVYIFFLILGQHMV